jgi:hypothetical protein
LLRVRIFLVLGSLPLAQLRASDVQALVGRMEGDGVSPPTIRQAHLVLGQVLDAAVADGMLVRNVARCCAGAS